MLILCKVNFHFKIRQNPTEKEVISFISLILKVGSNCKRARKCWGDEEKRLTFHHAHVFRQLWRSHKSLHCILLYVKFLLSIHHILYGILHTVNKTSFELIHTQLNVFFLKHTLMSALKIRLANLHSQSAVYGGFSGLDTAVLFVIESLSLLQARIWRHSVFAFSFSWSSLNKLSDMPD